MTLILGEFRPDHTAGAPPRGVRAAAYATATGVSPAVLRGDGCRHRGERVGRQVHDGMLEILDSLGFGRIKVEQKGLDP
jgi:hypothetical protein